MNFYKWRKNDILSLNKFRVPEPIKSKIITPDIILVPILAFDKIKIDLVMEKDFMTDILNSLKKNKKI